SAGCCSLCRAAVTDGGTDRGDLGPGARAETSERSCQLLRTWRTLLVGHTHGFTAAKRRSRCPGSTDLRASQCLAPGGQNAGTPQERASSATVTCFHLPNRSGAAFVCPGTDVVS